MRNLIFLGAMIASTQVCAAEPWSFATEVRRIVSGQKSDVVAQSEFDATRERARTKQWGFLPSVNATASRGMYRDSFVDPEATRSSAVGLDVNVNVFRFGADAADRRRANESVTAASLRREGKLLTAESKAAKVLSDAIAARLSLAAYQRRIVTAQQAVVAAEARYKKGILSEQELSKLNLESASLMLSLKSVERTAEQAVALVEALGGSIPKDVQWPIGRKIEAVRNWVKSLQASGLEVKTLEAEARAADAAVAGARGAMLPSVDLGGTWKKNMLDGVSSAQDTQQVVATLSVPLFSKFSDSGEYRARVHESAAAQASLDGARAVAPQEFKYTVNGLLALMDEAAERDRQIVTADRLYRDNLQRFERGLISVNDLSLDEHRVREAELAAVDTWQKVHQEIFHVAELAGTSAVGVL